MGYGRTVNIQSGQPNKCDKCAKMTEYHLVDPHYGDEIWIDQCGCQSIWIKKIRIKDEKVKEIC